MYWEEITVKETTTQHSLCSMDYLFCLFYSVLTVKTFHRAKKYDRLKLNVASSVPHVWLAFPCFFRSAIPNHRSPDRSWSVDPLVPGLEIFPEKENNKLT